MRVVFSFEYRPCKELRMSYDKALEAMWKGEYDTALTELQSLSPA